MRPAVDGKAAIGCHVTQRDMCVGFALVEGADNATLRIGMARAGKDYQALKGRERCFTSYVDMLAANGVDNR